MTQPATLTDKLDRAFTYAREHHANDIRKGTAIPYLSHLLGVCSLVLDMEGSEDEAIAALLHDVIEDGGGVEAEVRIRADFGEDVARIVRACSDTDEEPKPPWRPRKERVHRGDRDQAARRAARVARGQGPQRARDPARLPHATVTRSGTRFSAGRDEQLWYYRALASGFEVRRGDLGEAAGPAVDELRRVVEEIALISGSTT